MLLALILLSLLVAASHAGSFCFALLVFFFSLLVERHARVACRAARLKIPHTERALSISSLSLSLSPTDLLGNVNRAFSQIAEREYGEH